MALVPYPQRGLSRRAPGVVLRVLTLGLLPSRRGELCPWHGGLRQHGRCAIDGRNYRDGQVTDRDPWGRW